MSVDRLLLGIAGAVFLMIAVFIVAVVVDVSTSAGGGCGGG